MSKAIYITKYITLLLILILVIQFGFIAKLISANLFLKHETNKVEFIEKKVLTYTECPICNPCKSIADIIAQ